MHRNTKISFCLITVVALALAGCAFFIVRGWSSYLDVSSSAVPIERIGNIGENVEADFFTSDGVRIHYWFYNRGTPRTTVFLHGGPGHGTEDFRVWQAQEYADTFGSLLVFDQRGCGKSEKTEAIADTITFDRYIADINELRNYLISDKKVIIYGRSFGGLLAVNYAASQPKNVEAYVLVAPGPFDDPNAEAERTALKKSVGEDVVGKSIQDDYDRIYSRLALRENVVDASLQEHTTPVEDPNELNFDAAFNKGMPTFFENNYHLLTSLQDTPTLVVSGIYDIMVPPLEIDGMRSYLPKTAFVSLPGSHLAAYAYQDEFFATLQTFFNSFENTP